jgi:DMSO/TMAO reductase YedYZ heme-binding membrane subunit
MKNKEFWKKLSNISAYSCGTVAIIHTFFRSHIEDFIYVIIAIEIVTICLFLLSELMKFILKRKSNE